MHNNLRTFSDMQAGNCLSRTIIDASWLPNPGGTATSIGAPFLHFRINHGPPKRPGGEGTCRPHAGYLLTFQNLRMQKKPPQLVAGRRNQHRACWVINQTSRAFARTPFQRCTSRTLRGCQIRLQYQESCRLECVEPSRRFRREIGEFFHPSLRSRLC